jgi:hypothetical protein
MDRCSWEGVLHKEYRGSWFGTQSKESAINQRYTCKTTQKTENSMVNKQSNSFSIKHMSRGGGQQKAKNQALGPDVQ